MRNLNSIIHTSLLPIHTVKGVDNVLLSAFCFKLLPIHTVRVVNLSFLIFNLIKGEKMKLLVIGSSNIDMVVQTKKMPIPGETVLGGKFNMVNGGKGANQAVCAVKLGMDTGFLCRLGNDIFGQNTLKYFNDLGLDTSQTKLLDGVASGVALITVDESAENSIVVASGANNEVKPSDLDEDYMKTVDGVLMQFEIPMETVECAIEKAYNLNKIVVVNPAPANELSQSALKKIDILIPNKNEARQLLGMAPDDESLSPEELAKKLREKGVKNVVITLGTQGSFVSSEKEGDFYVKAHKVKAVDTTGAGDSYCASLTCAYLEGKTLKESAEFASKVSALKVTKLGAQTTPTREEVDNFKD